MGPQPTAARRLTHQKMQYLFSRRKDAAKRLYALGVPKSHIGRLGDYTHPGDSVWHHQRGGGRYEALPDDESITRGTEELLGW